MPSDPTITKPNHQQADPLRVDPAVPLDPETYQSLLVGPRLSLELEPNEAQPLDGSNSLLRTLSPFVIQIEPPLVLGSEPAGLYPSAKGSRVTGLYGSALKQRSGFTSARAALAMETYVQGNYGPGTAEEILSRGAARSSGGTIHNSGDGTRKTDSSGQEAVGKVGEPAIADLRTAVDIARQLQAILATPPLVLLINPQNLSIAHTKIQAFQDRSRHGYIYQAWGEDQPKLSIEAKCGAFISGGRGVQWASKRDSRAWQNLSTAFQFFRNNGYIYDTVGKSEAHLLVGALSIRYDQWIYFGNMASLSYAFEDGATMHGGVTFSMEFVASAIVDTASPSFNVSPMRKPNPWPGDSRYSGIENRAFNRSGELSIGSESGATSILPSTGTSSRLQPENGTPLEDSDFITSPTPPTPRGPETRPRGTQGFATPEVEVEPAVTGVDPDEVQPFRQPGDQDQRPTYSRGVA
jgi:hypothetical protein